MPPHPEGNQGAADMPLLGTPPRPKTPTTPAHLRTPTTPASPSGEYLHLLESPPYRPDPDVLQMDYSPLDLPHSPGPEWDRWTHLLGVVTPPWARSPERPTHDDDGPFAFPFPVTPGRGIEAAVQQLAAPPAPPPVPQRAATGLRPAEKPKAPTPLPPARRMPTRSPQTAKAQRAPPPCPPALKRPVPCPRTEKKRIVIRPVSADMLSGILAAKRATKQLAVTSVATPTGRTPPRYAASQAALSHTSASRAHRASNRPSTSAAHASVPPPDRPYTTPDEWRARVPPHYQRDRRARVVMPRPWGGVQWRTLYNPAYV